MSTYSTIIARNVEVRRSGEVSLDIPELIISTSSRLTLVGDNGAGKSTLVKILVGESEPTHGEVIKDDSLTIGYLPQEPTSSISESHTTVLPYMVSDHSDLSELALRMSSSYSGEEDADSGNYDKDAEAEFNGLGGYQLWKIAAGMQISRPMLFRPIDTLSPGQLSRILLSKLLFDSPDIIFLDEPTNHLDPKTSDWLQQFLIHYHGGIVLVTHDRHFLSAITREIAEIDDETKELTFFRGTYFDYLDRKKAQQTRSLQQYQERQKAIKGLKGKLLDVGSDLTRTRTRRDNDKIAFKGKGERSQTKKNKLNRKLRRQLETLEMESAETPSEIQTLNWEIDSPSKASSGINMCRVSFGYDHHTILEDCSASVSPGEHIIITGDNGVGKSTLFKLITGELKPLSGHINITGAPRIEYLPQTQKGIPPESTPVELLQQSSWARFDRRSGIEALLSIGLLNKPTCFLPFGRLSIGQQRRFLLCKIILSKPDLILLDEPTNHIDCLNASRLEEQLKDFKGTLICVSHDRYFIEYFSDTATVWQLSNKTLKVILE